MSWDKSADWYDRLVGSEGHYYHEKVVIPKALSLLNLGSEGKFLDLGCGQGVLAQKIPRDMHYVGLDASKTLIDHALSRRGKNAKFLVHDLCAKPFPEEAKGGTHAAFILSLQNMSDGEKAIKHSALSLTKGGKLLIVMNHPCFRIPRQSGWEIDNGKKLKFRRIDRYMTPLDIPITTNPGKTSSHETISYHNPLSTYFQWLQKANYKVLAVEEWCSDKVSEGPKKPMEDRARKEFPLFLAILAVL